MVDLTYIPSSASDIWTRSVALGYESNGTERLYTCLATVHNVLYAGKTSPALGSCRIARGELEVATPTFQLIGDYAADPEAPPVTKAAKSSSRAWSAIYVKLPTGPNTKRFCLARRTDNDRTSEHPGWEQDGVCDYAYGSGAQHAATNFSYVIPRYSTPGGTFFKAGDEADGSPLGTCRVEHPAGTGMSPAGKYVPTLNQCDFEYGDRRQVHTSRFRALK